MHTLSHQCLEFLQKSLSVSKTFLTIIFELRMILQNISRRVVGNVRINILHEIYSHMCFCLQNFIKIYRLLLAIVSITRLNKKTTYTQLTLNTNMQITCIWVNRHQIKRYIHKSINLNMPMIWATIHILNLEFLSSTLLLPCRGLIMSEKVQIEVCNTQMIGHSPKVHISYVLDIQRCQMNFNQN